MIATDWDGGDPNHPVFGEQYKRQHVHIDKDTEVLRLHTPTGDQYEIPARLVHGVTAIGVRTVPLFQGVEVPRSILEADRENGDHRLEEGFQHGVMAAAAAFGRAMEKEVTTCITIAEGAVQVTVGENANIADVEKAVEKGINNALEGLVSGTCPPYDDGHNLGCPKEDRW